MLVESMTELCWTQIIARWAGDRALQRQVLWFAASIAWIALCLLLHPGRFLLGLGWIGLDVAGLSLFLAVACSGTQAARGMLVTGVSAACALGIAMIGNTLSRSDCFGLGNINYILDSTSPQLLCLSVLVGHRLWHRQRMPVVATAVSALGLATLLWAILWSSYIRRGPLIAMVVVAAALALPWCYRRYRRTTVAAGACGVVVLLTALILAAQVQLPSFRFDRLFIYHAAVQSILHRPLSGNGPYAALDFCNMPDEMARHWSSVGHWTLSAHCEWLDAMLAGGVLSGVLWLLTYGAVALRIARIAEPGERAAAIALGAALLTHALTDNAYSTVAPRLVMYASLGLIFLCRTQPDETAVTRPWLTVILARLPSPRIVGALGVLTGLLVATCELPSACLPVHAPPLSHLRALRCTVLPETVVEEFADVFEPLVRDRKLGTCKQAFDIARSRLGYFGPTITAQQQLAGTRLQVVEGDPVLWATQTEQAHDLEVGDAVAAHVQLLGVFPFQTESYLTLGATLLRHPSVVQAVPDAVYRPLTYLANCDAQPLSALSGSAGSMDEAILLYAQTYWWLHTGRAPAGAQPSVLALAQRYGDNPDVARLVLDWAALGPVDAKTIGRLRPPLSLGLVIYTTVEQQAAALSGDATQARTSGCSRSFAALVAALYPAYWQDFRTHHARDDDSPVRNACMVIFGQARDAKHGAGW